MTPVPKSFFHPWFRLGIFSIFPAGLRTHFMSWPEESCHIHTTTTATILPPLAIAEKTNIKKNLRKIHWDLGWLTNPCFSDFDGSVDEEPPNSCSRHIELHQTWWFPWLVCSTLSVGHHLFTYWVRSPRHLSTEPERTNQRLIVIKSQLNEATQPTTIREVCRTFCWLTFLTWRNDSARGQHTACHHNWRDEEDEEDREQQRQPQ